MSATTHTPPGERGQIALLAVGKRVRWYSERRGRRGWRHGEVVELTPTTARVRVGDTVVSLDLAVHRLEASGRQPERAA